MKRENQQLAGFSLTKNVCQTASQRMVYLLLCDGSDSSPQTRHKPKYCHRRVPFHSFFSFQYQIYHSTIQFVQFPKRLKHFQIFLKTLVFVEENECRMLMSELVSFMCCFLCCFHQKPVDHFYENKHIIIPPTAFLPIRFKLHREQDIYARHKHKDYNVIWF